MTSPRPNIENLTSAGDVITEEITITTRGKDINISAFVVQLSLFEDIFSNVMNGHAVIVDANNLISGFPFCGDEYITISYRTPSFQERIAKSFYITEVSDRGFSSNDREAMYVVQFVSNEAVRDNTVFLSRKYSGTTDSIIRNIYEEHVKIGRFVNKSGDTPTDFVSGLASNVAVVPTFWSPFKTINWCASRSFETGSRSPNFLFYESNKAFYFTNIDRLIERQVDANNIFAEYIYFPGAETTQDAPSSNYKYTKPELQKQYSIVRAIRPFKNFSIFEGMDFGYYGSKLITMDMVLKQHREKIFNYEENFSKFRHLEKNNFPPFSRSVPNAPPAHTSLLMKHYKVHDNANDPLYEKWALERNSLMFGLSTIKLEIEVPGRTDIEVGRIVNFLFPKNIDKQATDITEDMLDPFMSGLYLITSIRHDFSLNNHTMFIEMVKDSFAKEIT